MSEIRNSSIWNIIHADDETSSTKSNPFSGFNQLLKAAELIQRNEKPNSFSKSKSDIGSDSNQTMIDEAYVPEMQPKIHAICQKINQVKLTPAFTAEHHDFLEHLYWNIPTAGPFICQVEGCSKEFKRKDNLKSHIRTHIPNRNRPFECDKCQKGYLRQVDLFRHIETVHMGIRRFLCINCNKAFTRKEGLKIHSERCI